MSSRNRCRLCVDNCTYFKKIYDENNHPNHLHGIIVKFFHPTILNIEKHTELKGICRQCWWKILAFTNFQKAVFEAQAKLEDQEVDVKQEVFDEETMVATNISYLDEVITPEAATEQQLISYIIKIEDSSDSDVVGQKAQESQGDGVEVLDVDNAEKSQDEIVNNTCGRPGSDLAIDIDVENRATQNSQENQEIQDTDDPQHSLQVEMLPRDFLATEENEDSQSTIIYNEEHIDVGDNSNGLIEVLDEIPYSSTTGTLGAMEANSNVALISSSIKIKVETDNELYSKWPTLDSETLSKRHCKGLETITTTAASPKHLCPHCKLGFASIVYLRRHYEQAHGIVLQLSELVSDKSRLKTRYASPWPKREYKCNQCPTISSSYVELAVHRHSHRALINSIKVKREPVSTEVSEHPKQGVQELPSVSGDPNSENEVDFHRELVALLDDINASTEESSATPRDPKASEADLPKSNQVDSSDADFVCKLCKQHYIREHNLRKHYQTIHNLSPVEYTKFCLEEEQKGSQTNPQNSKKSSEELTSLSENTEKQPRRQSEDDSQQTGAPTKDVAGESSSISSTAEEKIEIEHYVCQFCKKDYMLEHNLRKHYEVVHNMIPCHLCQEVLASRDTLQLHYRDVHEMSQDVAKELKDLPNANLRQKAVNLTECTCHLCKYTLSSIYEVRRHYINVHDIPRKDAEDLIKLPTPGQRERIVAQVEFVCKQCQKLFKSRKELPKHYRDSHKLSNDKIKELLPNMASFVIRKFKCSRCDRKFVTEKERTLHAKTHQGTGFKLNPVSPLRKYKCFRCSQEFRTENERNLHDRKMHLQTSSPVAKTQPPGNATPKYKCSSCDQEFFTAYDRNVHVKIHQALPVHVCDYCLQTFPTRDELLLHKLKLQHYGYNPTQKSVKIKK